MRRQRSKYGAARAFIVAALQEQSGDCVIWPFVTVNGYGRFSSGKFSKWAHREVCRIAHGAPFEDAEAAHKCGNRACVNPRHLRWATHQENSDDWAEQSTWGNGLGPARGERHTRAKLNEALVREIRASTERHVDLARKFGVSPKAIQKIRFRQSWAHVA